MARDRRGQLDALLDVELVLPRERSGDDATAVDGIRSAPRAGSSAGALAPGERLGKFVLERELGAGGMGTVWRARDVELDRAVALKVLSSELQDHGTARVRMVREARAMARLHHPNVITVFDAITIDGRDVIAMELIDGETMASWLSRAQPSDAVIATVIAAGRGLAAAHAAGMIHRDFKPHNVLVARNGRIVVTDFGLARAIGDALAPPTAADLHALGALDSPLTATGTVLGTPAYMAPEQLVGAAANAQADQFAFCATAWEALGGLRPFPGDTVPMILDALASGRPRGGEHVPRRLRPILERGLAIDPAARWPSIDALLDALIRTVRRPRRIALGVLTAAVIAGGVIAFAAVRHHPRAPLSWHPQIVDLPAFEENSDGPAISPDTTMIAYASDRERSLKFRIYLVPVTGGDAHAITPVGETFMAPRWRRDGKALLLVHWDTAAGGYHVVELPLAGGPLIDLGPGWAADDCGDAIAIADNDQHEGRLVLRRADGSRDVLVRTASEYVLAPRCDRTGDKIVFTRGVSATFDHPVDNVYLIDRARHEVQLTTGNATGGGTFTPDGRSVVYGALTFDGAVSLFEVGIAGGRPYRLTLDNGPHTSPDVSSDGRFVAFERDESARVPVIGGDGTSRRLALQREAMLSLVPVPDGTSLVAERLGQHGSEVVVISTRDGSERFLVEGTQPFLSRDGKLVYYRPRTGAPVLAAISIDGGTPQVLAALPAELAIGVDAADGQHLELRVDGRFEAWRVGLDHQAVSEHVEGLVIPAPSGGWRAVRTFSGGYIYRFVAPDGTARGAVKAETERPTWLDDHRFAYAAGGAFHIVDVTTGAEVAKLPGPAWGEKVVLGADGVHWYDLEVVGHVTQHLLVNFADRPWRF